MFKFVFICKNKFWKLHLQDKTVKISRNLRICFEFYALYLFRACLNLILKVFSD